MLHYLFTNDLRRNQWPDILVDSARLIRDDKVPDQHTDKSKNNYINTQQSYLCIQKGTKANDLCCKGDAKVVILNFVNRFQFPNARTEDSFKNAVADHMATAPLRCAVQLLFMLGMVDAEQAHMTCSEFAKYIICNPVVATGTADLLSLAQQVISDRRTGVVTPNVPDSSALASIGIEWKHCPRQIGEMFYLLQFVPFISLVGDEFKFVMPTDIDASLAKMFFYIVNNHELWRPPNTSNWSDIQRAYLEYMDSGISQCMAARGNVSECSRPRVNFVTAALRMFAERRDKDGAEGWTSFDTWAKDARQTFETIDEGKIVAQRFDYKHFVKFVFSSRQRTAFLGFDDAGKKAVGKFLREERTSPHAVSWYLDPANKVPADGVGIGVMLNFMMKLRPDEFATWSKLIDSSLFALGLRKDADPKPLTVANYEESKALQQIVLQKMHEMGIGKAADDNSEADYLTVNEFLWWLGQDDNKDLIKEKIMSKQWKPVNSKAKKVSGSRTLSEAFKDDEMLKRLAAALRTKPFAILAGHSGTGKSQLVRRLAYMTCNNQTLIDEGKDKSAPGNYCMVQVKPNWHDSTDLLGYYSEMGGRHFVNTPFVEFICKAYAYPDTPFFVCLDEMNLAPVEQYFAEYLSAIESMEEKDGVWVTDPLAEVDKTGEKDENGKDKFDPAIVDQIMKGAPSTEAADWIQKHGLTIPKNVFVVGTVNMDETTCQFSRKVLDRAMTLLMNEVKFAGMSGSKKPSEEDLLDDDGLKFFLGGTERGEVGAIESALLDGINIPLANTAFVVAYRFANEYALYESAWAKLNGVDLAAASDDDKKKIAEKALDHVVLMKLLPRIHGERRIVEGIFNGRKIKGADGDKDLPGLKSKVLGGLSAAMMDAILARSDEYLTFWP